MKKILCVFTVCYLANSCVFAEEDVYCTDPNTGLRYPVNSTWPSTTFCGSYTCHAIVENENGNSKKVLKIVPNIKNKKDETSAENEGDTLENNSDELYSDENKNIQSRRENSESGEEENEFGKLYELYKVASDLGESIKKAESELDRKYDASKNSENHIEKEYKADIIDADQKKENHIENQPQPSQNYYQNIPQVYNDEMTAALYRDYNKYLAQYYSQYPYYNYKHGHHQNCNYIVDKNSKQVEDDADTSPSNVAETYYSYDNSNPKYNFKNVNVSNDSESVCNNNYYNYWNEYPTRYYQNGYNNEIPKVSRSHETYQQHDHDDNGQNLENQSNHIHKEEEEPTTVYDESNYESEYHSFYHDYTTKYPNSTAYSARPTEEDTKHFYDLYYEKFPYKRPETETVPDQTEEKREDFDDNNNNVNDEEYENPETPVEFETSETDRDKDTTMEELEKWADYKHPEDTIEWKPNPFEVSLDKDVHLTTSKLKQPHRRIGIGKYDWINSKLGQFGVPLPGKPFRSPNLNPLLPPSLLQPRLRNIMRKLPGLYQPHFRRRRSPRMKTFMTVKGCNTRPEPGYFRNGDPHARYPHCCPQKIHY